MDSSFNNMPSRDNRPNSSEDFLQRAAAAVNSGNKILGIHLYLAAFEQSLHENIVPSTESMSGIDKAWALAIETKQRALAEYIFERLEPFWTPDVMNKRAGELQGLAIDKLEEFGFPREALEGMAEFMNQDLSQILPGLSGQSGPTNSIDVKFEKPSAAAVNNADAPAFPTSFDVPNTTSAPAPAEPKQESAPTFTFPSGPLPQIIIPSKKKREETKKKEQPKQPRFNYSFINGFDTTIEDMRKLGVGCKNDKEFDKFIKDLNFRHGVPSMPSLGTLIFSCPSREDANYFMVATVGEIEIPAVRLRLDQNAQGQVVLCVMSSPDFKQKLNTIPHAGFTSPCAVILEDLDLWDFPEMEGQEDNAVINLAQLQLTRGAREALALVKAALETPEVTVFISAQNVDDIDPFFTNMMNSCRVVEMDLPNEKERRKCWRAAQGDHPSMRGLDVNQLVYYSKNMSRFEIFAVANELVEDAYRQSMAQFTFKAVSTDDAIARLSSFQPLGSKEYQEMEDLVAADFRLELEKLTPDDFLRGY